MCPLLSESKYWLPISKVLLILYQYYYSVDKNYSSKISGKIDERGAFIRDEEEVEYGQQK